MNIVIEYQGKRYEGKEAEDGASLSDAVSTVYDNMAHMDRLKVELKDGGFLVIGKDAVQSAAILFLP